MPETQTITKEDHDAAEELIAQGNDPVLVRHELDVDAKLPVSVYDEKTGETEVKQVNEIGEAPLVGADVHDPAYDAATEDSWRNPNN
jgi:hypothetical protein